MTDTPRTIIYEDGEVLLDTADPTTYVTLSDGGLPATSSTSTPRRRWASPPSR